MSDVFHTLASQKLEESTTYLRPVQQLPDRVSLESSALDVMTDLTKVTAITVNPCAPLEAANERMVVSGVRLLLVTDQRHNVQGLITATDLLGDKPMRYLQEVGGKREDIMARDIMTPQGQLEVLEMKEVERAKVGDVVATLLKAHRQHALVVETNEDGNQVIRGILSTKQISLQLGSKREMQDSAATFAELESMLNQGQ